MPEQGVDIVVPGHVRAQRAADDPQVAHPPEDRVWVTNGERSAVQVSQWAVLCQARQ
jgi:hypothetical protein